MRTPIRQILAAAGFAAVALTAWAGPEATDAANAEQAAPDELASEIVVTGSRLREESVQNAPVAVSVLGESELQSLHAADIRGLSSEVPNLSITAAQAVPGTPVISLRGFSVVTSDIATEPGVAVYIDGVYQAVTAGGLTDLLDEERIEVLRGPQSTLLGKNAAAGAVLVTRTRPTGEWGAKLNVDYSTFDTLAAQGLLNFPLVEGKLSGKIFASHREREDYVRNTAVPGADTGGQNISSVRLAFLFTPFDDFELYLSGDYYRDRSAQNGARNLASPTSLLCTTYDFCAPGAGRYQVTTAGFIDGNRTDERNLTANLKWNFGAVQLTGITGWRNINPRANFDLDSSPANVAETYDYEVDLDQFSQELRLSSTQGGGADFGGRLSWVVGGYYGDSDGFMAQGVRVLGTSRNQTQNVIRHSRALFAQSDFDLTSALTLSVGARKSWDTTRHEFSLNTPGTDRPLPDNAQSVDFQNTSFEGGLQYKFSDTKMVYVRYAEGYRGGGFIGLPSSLQVALPYDDETSASYELGVKTEWFDRALRLNLTLFDVEYDDLQRTVTIAAPPPAPANTFVLVTDNAASARTRGVELETQYRPTDHFSVRATGGYLDAGYKKYVSLLATGQPVDLSSTAFPYAPKWTASVTPKYDFALSGSLLGFHSVELQGNVDWRSRQNVSVTLHPAAAVPSYATLGAQVKLTGGDTVNYIVTLYGDNLADKHVVTYGADIPGLSTYVFDNLGRVVGVSLGVNF